MTIQQHLDDLEDELARLSHEIYDHPETGFEAHRAVATLTGALRQEGFTIETDSFNVPTAFTATHAAGDDRPNIAILLEYDALPGLGHGCGHNLIASGGAIAAMALARAWPDHPGTLTVIGTPAEEGGGGKVLLCQAGAFDGVDAAMMFHPSDRSLRSKHALAASHGTVTFTGKAAHAAKTPWEGRSALAALQVFLVAVDSMRQFIPPTARIHYVITDGGDSSNIVPAHTSLNFTVRDITDPGTDDLLRRITLAAEGAATATETTVDVSVDPLRYSCRINNMTMADHFASTFERLGIAMPAGEPDEPSGSSDIGNVSQLVPTIHPCVNITTEPTAGHSQAFKAASATDHALQQTRHAALALANLASDLLPADSVLLKQTREEFAASQIQQGR